MIVILASQFDKLAKDLISKWREHDEALLLTSKDLSRNGWKYWPNNPEQSVAVIDNKDIPVKEITGVLTRLPYIYEKELPHIVTSDRQYVAAEMMAFLVSWLTTLRCPVLNYPSVFCLTGPNWRQEQWLHTAAKIGIPTRRYTCIGDKSISNNEGKQDNCTEDTLSRVTVTIVGDFCFSSFKDQNILAKSLSLAKMARADLVTLLFDYKDSEFFFVNAELCPAIISDEIEEAVLEYLQDGYRQLKYTKDIRLNS